MLTMLKNELINTCKNYPELKIDFRLGVWKTDFLRFFNSQINYNISKNLTSLHCQVFKGKKSYSFSVENPDIDKFNSEFKSCLALIDSLPEDPDFVDLETDKTLVEPYAKTDNTAFVSLENKIEILNRMAKKLSPIGFNIYGTFICNYDEVYIINSNGLNKHMLNSPIMLEVKAVNTKNQVTVLQSFGGENFNLFDEELFTSSLYTKAKAATTEVVDVNPNHYEVILAPRCIAELVSYLTWVGFSASSLDRKSSFFEGKENQKLFPEHITITDDPTEDGLIQYDYNYDGHVCKPVEIIKNGVFKNFLVDNYYGNKLKMQKNGASFSCISLEHGNTKLEDMIASTQNGLYISSFHYMNFINPKETSITGLTRDGTFIIKDGKISQVVNNLRFTVKITDVLENIIEMENKATSTPFSQNYDAFGIDAVKAPHVKVKNFNITSSTKTI